MMYCFGGVAGVTEKKTLCLSFEDLLMSQRSIAFFWRSVTLTIFPNTSVDLINKSLG